MLEVADIVDELKMIRHLVNQQRGVLKSSLYALSTLNPSQNNDPEPRTSINISVASNRISDNGCIVVNSRNILSGDEELEEMRLLAKGIAGAAKDISVSTDEVLVPLCADLDVIRNDADQTHSMVWFFRLSSREHWK